MESVGNETKKKELVKSGMVNIFLLSTILARLKVKGITVPGTGVKDPETRQWLTPFMDDISDFLMAVEKSVAESGLELEKFIDSNEGEELRKSKEILEFRKFSSLFFMQLQWMDRQGKSKMEQEEYIRQVSFDNGFHGMIAVNEEDRLIII